MKKLFLSFLLAITLINCNSNKNQASNSKDEIYASYGSNITSKKAISATNLKSKYNNLKVGDTVTLKFKSTIKEVCQNKGCWMKLDIGDNKETFVKFKDYAFFMPKDSKGKEVILNGKAFVSQESVEDQKHYAGDAGKSQAEIDAITKPKTIYSFTADGVLIKK